MKLINLDRKIQILSDYIFAQANISSPGSPLGIPVISVEVAMDTTVFSFPTFHSLHSLSNSSNTKMLGYIFPYRCLSSALF